MMMVLMDMFCSSCGTSQCVILTFILTGHTADSYVLVEVSTMFFCHVDVVEGNCWVALVCAVPACKKLARGVFSTCMLIDCWLNDFNYMCLPFFFVV
jgi:hypothetical protein